MKRFNYTELWTILSNSGHTTGDSVQPDTAFNEFVTEIYAYCRREKDPAERTRTLRFARIELVIVQKRIHTGAGKKCAVTGCYNPSYWVN